MRSCVALCGVLVVLLLVGGCAAPYRSATLTLDGAGYQRAIETTRQVLRERGFTIDRVDAIGGVITTKPLPAAGYATPWLDVSPGTGNALGATLSAERRVVVVTFDGGEPSPGSASVRVEVFRLDRPLRRYDSTSIRFRSEHIDPSGRTPALRYVRADDDPELAQRLAAMIGDRLNGGG